MRSETMGRRNAYLAFLLVGVVVALMVSGNAADAFLGTQGDVWDTQWDMLFALIGALTAQLMLGRIHDRSLATLGVEPQTVA